MNLAQRMLDFDLEKGSLTDLNTLVRDAYRATATANAIPTVAGVQILLAEAAERRNAKSYQQSRRISVLALGVAVFSLFASFLSVATDIDGRVDMEDAMISWREVEQEQTKALNSLVSAGDRHALIELRELLYFWGFRPDRNSLGEVWRLEDQWIHLFDSAPSEPLEGHVFLGSAPGLDQQVVRAWTNLLPDQSMKEEDEKSTRSTQPR